MMGHNISFKGVIWKIIPKLSLLPLLFTVQKGSVSKFRNYRISSVIRRGFFSFQNNPKVLDPSCKTDLELWHCLGRVEMVL